MVFFIQGPIKIQFQVMGGIKHCLIPSPKQIVVDIDDDGNQKEVLYRDEQTVHTMLDILGYND